MACPQSCGRPIDRLMPTQTANTTATRTVISSRTVLPTLSLVNRPPVRRRTQLHALWWTLRGPATHSVAIRGQPHERFVQVWSGVEGAAMSSSGQQQGVPAEAVRSISVPNRVESRLRALNFVDGCPSSGTSELVYDHIDFVHALNVFLNGFAGPPRTRCVRVSKRRDEGTTIVFAPGMSRRATGSRRLRARAGSRSCACKARARRSTTRAGGRARSKP
jgi:hypothetical protein